jgi:hypothetical protein
MTVLDIKIKSNSKMFTRFKNLTVVHMSNAIVDYKVKLWNSDRTTAECTKISVELDNYFTERIKDINRLKPNELKKLALIKASFDKMMKILKQKL